MRDSVVVVDSVSKTFILPHSRNNSVKSAFVNIFKGKSYEKQLALSDVSFSVKQGDFFGIVGRNGSGKSTLLKLLAGIYSTDSGAVSVTGSLTPFIELGVGFSPELTGKENVYLNGALLGFSRKEMATMYDEIVNFSGLERFMDQKLKNYSSGMQVRLAFSIAVRTDSDVLIFDEVLAVGDEAFQKKCVDVLRKIKQDPKKTVILVTHDMGWVEKFCDRVAVIDKGKLVDIYDNPHEASIKYSELNLEEDKSEQSKKNESGRWGSKEIIVSDFKITQEKSKKYMLLEKPLTIEISMANKNLNETEEVLIGIGIYNDSGLQIFGPNSQSHAVSPSTKIAKFKIPGYRLNEGNYRVGVGLFSKDQSKTYDFIDKAYELIVKRGKKVESQVGSAYLDGEWIIK